MFDTHNRTNYEKTVRERAERILAGLSLEEKACQLDMLPDSWGDGRGFLKDGSFDEVIFRSNLDPAGTGSIHQREDRTTPRSYAESTNAVQRSLMAATRHGLPALVVAETLHGLVGPGCTVFPQAIGLAATWNPETVEAVGAAIARETRACGATVGLSPVLDVARDPRWGRMEETFGEDPWLVSRLGVAMVQGLQGKGPDFGKDRIIATIKHFAGHGAPLGGRDSTPVGYGSHYLREYALPPFESAIREGGAESIMAAYSDWRSVPCNASIELLQDILRGEWGFKGFVMEDFGAVSLLATAHGVAEDFRGAVKIAVEAGLDQCFGPKIGRVVESLVRSGELAENVLDEAVLRALSAKIKLGLLDDPLTDPDLAENICDCADHRALARRASCEGIVLLTNPDGFLPLGRDLRRIAVIGPNADVVETGDYSGFCTKLITPLEGIRRAVMPDTEVLYAQGCQIVGVPKKPVAIPGKLLTPRGTARGVAPQAGASGIFGEYWDNDQLEGEPRFTRVDPSADAWWPEWSALPGLDTREPWSLRWTGVLTPEASGEYRIGVRVDGGARLRLDGKLVLEEWEPGPLRERLVEARLIGEGRHEVELEYRNPGAPGFCAFVYMGAAVEDAEASIREAVAVAARAEVAVVCVGDSSATSGEIRDRAELELSGGQDKLVRAVYATGTPMILVHVGGRPLTMEWAFDHAAAALTIWFPGEEGGDALADVLFGDCNPSGKLPMSWPAHVGQLPMPYDLPQTGRGGHSGYPFTPSGPRFPFGHGLSYTRFVYSDLVVPASVGWGEPVRVAVTVLNAGDRSGAEVIQLYVRDLKASVKRPLRQLRGFERVNLEPGESRRVEFLLNDQHLSFWNAKLERVVEPGVFRVMVGGSSDATLAADFSLAPPDGR